MMLPLEACFSLVLTILVESALTAQSTTPAWRSFHSSAVANGKLIIFGGINNTVSGKNPIQLPGTTDLFVWDLKTRIWFQPEQDRPPKTPQKLQVSISPITSDKIFTFMPYAENGEGPVAVLDTNSWSWSYVTSSGAVPLSRLAFTYTIANEEAYLFGGTQADANGALNGANILSDLSDFDTSQQVWYSASPGPAIYFQAACYLASQNSILYFGGSAQDQAVNRLHLFNLSTRGWTLDVPYTGENGGSSVPSARIGHTANCLTDKMIVFGGTGGTGQDTINSPNDNDVWILEFVNGTYAWSRAPIKNRSKSPTARMGKYRFVEFA
ncbi:hypothetical protein K7432_016433 [Basidiobolus ranarum]|uniref:Kelch repeat-containing protein n=1 Tax=Basidiobolus ranarum TaxID=34480 RepID=A0ABR2WES2_9FUNG